MLRFRHRMRPRKMAVRPGAGQEGRLFRLRQLVSGLIRYERIEPSFHEADEARQYAERLLYLAIKNGDKHKETMELADFWLLEKDLIHKLFKVLVPRYQNFKTCYTDLHKLAVDYPGHGFAKGVLELRGNPWPPIVPRRRDTQHILSNVLLSAARQDYYNNKKQQAQAAAAATSKESSPSPPSTEEKEFSSSVDPPQTPGSDTTSAR